MDLKTLETLYRGPLNNLLGKGKEEPDDEAEQPDPQAAATGLLERALRIGHEKDDADWLHNSAVKAQMKRMDPSFSERHSATAHSQTS